MKEKKYLFFAQQDYSYSILRPLQEAIWARGDSVAWFLSGDEINRDYLRENEVSLTTVKQVRDYAPIAVFSPGNITPRYFPGVKVTGFHGFNARKRSNNDHFFIRHFFDLYCTQGPDTTSKFQQLAQQHGNFRVVETGWTKLDPLFAPDINKTCNKKPVVLYSSTFSKKLTSAPYILETIAEASKNDDIQWLITLHPKTDKTIADAYKNIQNENLTFFETDDILPLLLKADAMLCDTSSILQEFLILNKPVVTYKNRFPDECMVNVTKLEEIIPAINMVLTRPESLMNKIQHYADCIHPYRDGKSSERVLDAVDWYIKTGHKGLKRKPLNLFRRFKARRKLGYYWI
jgi:CDP-glycerol glycerophosphotransferase (TagB/SpsB family)